MKSHDQDARSGEIRRDLSSAAHDLNNLLYRLSILSETLQSQLPEPAMRDEARDLLEDTGRRLSAIVDRLRRLSSSEAGSTNELP